MKNRSMGCVHDNGNSQKSRDMVRTEFVKAAAEKFAMGEITYKELKERIDAGSNKQLKSEQISVS